MPEERSEMPAKQASEKAKSGNVFGQARKLAKILCFVLSERVFYEP